jgi:tRNA(Ile)-lysidine synthase
LTPDPPGQDRGGLPERVAWHLERTGLIPEGAPVLIALSGGLDSVVLLHLLRFHLRQRVGELSAAHFDHAMRPDSIEDARWVAGLCAAWQVPLAHRRADPPPTSEADARHARYRFLHESAPADALILTAHHADDQAETVLFRLARGTGLHGLRGIAPRRGRLVRPLLPFQRADLEAYAATRRLSFRTDPTNLELRYPRNRIRHQVLPALDAVRPGVVPRLAAIAAEARSAESAWDQVVDAVEKDVVSTHDGPGVPLARERLRSYHPHVQVRLLRRLLRRYGSPPGRAGTQAALEFINSGQSGGVLHLPGGVRLERDFDTIRIVAPGVAGPVAERPAEIHGSGSGSARALVGGRVVRLSWGAAAREVARGGMPVVRLRAPVFPLVLRGWRPGDRIRLGYGSKKLKKLFSERRLDRRMRSRVPVLVDGRGEVVWVVGLALADGVAGGEDEFPIAVSDAGAI